MAAYSTAIQWSVFPNPETDHERFWNIEHLEVYAVYSTATTKVRNGIVQERWALCKRLCEVSQMRSDRRNPATIDSLQESPQATLLVAQQECTKKTVTGVDRNLQKLNGDASNGNDIFIREGAHSAMVGWHQLCLTPPLQEIPTGCWLCPECVCAQVGPGSRLVDPDYAPSTAASSSSSSSSSTSASTSDSSSDSNSSSSSDSVCDSDHNSVTNSDCDSAGNSESD